MNVSYIKLNYLHSNPKRNETKQQQQQQQQQNKYFEIQLASLSLFKILFINVRLELEQ